MSAALGLVFLRVIFRLCAGNIYNISHLHGESAENGLLKASVQFSTVLQFNTANLPSYRFVKLSDKQMS